MKIISIFIWKPLVKLNRLNKHKPTIIFKDTLW